MDGRRHADGMLSGWRGLSGTRNRLRVEFRTDFPQPPKPSTCRGRTRFWLWGERLRRGQEGIAHRVVRGEQDAHATGIADHGGADLEQLDADGGGRSAR